MAAPLPSNDCERARGLISAWLDGELSELGRAGLDAHVAECGECREYRRGAERATLLLRSTPLEELRVPISLPRARHRLARIAQTGSAAAAAVAVAVLALTGTLSRHTTPSSPPVLSNTNRTHIEAPNLDFRLMRSAALIRANPARVTARLAQ
jgi:predicted anti-sigma-YlaC factor YlaD